MKYSYFHWALHPGPSTRWCLAIAYFHRPQRKVEPDFRCLHADPRRGRKRADRQGNRRACAHRDTVRNRYLARPRRAADQQRHELPLGTGVSKGIALTIIGVMTVLFILSAVSGVGKGIQFLSNMNMIIAMVLLVFLVCIGPTIFIFNTFTESLGFYLSDLVTMSFRTAAFSDGKWLGSWTIFYWAWWVSWAPFVGVFIARISRGRTIREFIIGVLLIPKRGHLHLVHDHGWHCAPSELLRRRRHRRCCQQPGAAVSLFAFWRSIHSPG